MKEKGVFDFDDRIARAWQEVRGCWPERLTSGVMFFDGLRITIKEFNDFGIALGGYLFEEKE